MIGPAILGALIGLAFGIVDFVLLGYVASKRAQGRPAERLGSNLGLTVVRVSQLLMFPLIGWFAGPVIASNLGG